MKKLFAIILIFAVLFTVSAFAAERPTHTRVNTPRVTLKLCGLDENAEYVHKENGKVYRGDYRMNVGIHTYNPIDFRSTLYIFEKVK